VEIKNLGQLINHLAKKAGLDTSDQNLINLLSNSELTKITLHSDVVKAFDENLLSVTQAQDNHPLIGTKYKAEALNPIDKKLETLAEELGFDDATKQELAGIRNSYKKLEVFTAKFNELKENAVKEAAKGKGDQTSAALQKQVDELLQKMQAEKKSSEEAIQRIQGERKGDKIKFNLRSMLNNSKTIYDNLDPAIKAAAIEAILNKGLQDKEADFDFDEKDEFIVKKKDGTNLVGANHSKYTPQTLIDEILAQNKVLVVANSQQNPQDNQQQNNQTVNAENGQTKISGTNQSVIDMNMEALSAFNGQS
jgi:molybdenum-dependent DNA-binding transcriptional regulator ModE